MGENEKTDKENIENVNLDSENTDIKAENTDQTDDSVINSDSNESSVNQDAKIAELNDKYLRLYSEFDNYRKRTIKERSDLIKTAAEDVFKALLPVIDDFDRAIKANETIDDIQSIKEGLKLIHNKLKSTVQQKGLTAFDCAGITFDADTMEAITHIPATDDSQKGKVVDEIEKGYKLGDKVIRFAKVVIAQ
ncbi:MAG: nucleotide exchange factor GrpE [Sphingobacteriaceae bacterium]|nr:nucleotide exchange factor GrpE [Sphingobacteriaceae bacterium]